MTAPLHPAAVRDYERLRSNAAGADDATVLSIVARWESRSGGLGAAQRRALEVYSAEAHRTAAA